MFLKPPKMPDFVNADYAKIEERIMAYMAKVLGVPSDLMDTPTGRKQSDPEPQSLSDTGD